MPHGHNPAPGRADFASLRNAGREVLSLALIEVRNASLRWAAALETACDGQALTLGGSLPDSVAAMDPPLWTLGHLAWQQERRIARNVQRARGEAASPTGPRLASIRADADRWYDPAASTAGTRRELVAAGLPDLAATRQYLIDSLEITLDLLAGLPDDDADGLYFFRLCLFDEAACAEGFAVLAQEIGFETGLVPRMPTAAPRPALLVPATRWLLGADGPGFTYADQRQPYPIDIPEFEIDAQAVTWAQYGEFVEDGGYDEPALWSEAGRAWLAAQGRRTPRHVEQMRHGVLQRRFGSLARLPQNEPVSHVSWHEAESWCRWAGRRLPGEAEWEAAAHQAAAQGFRQGDVREWTANARHPYPGYLASPWQSDDDTTYGRQKSLRGASFATPPALRSRRLRHADEPEADLGFYGFRSCAP